MAPETLNITEVRGSFPALSGDQVFFDNAGGSQTLATVADRCVAVVLFLPLTTELIVPQRP
jgi:selenocysteine lyase/cysteine desulfurase